MGDYSRANEPKEQRMTDSERLENMLCIVFEIRTAFDLNDADRKQQYGSRGPKLLVKRLQDHINDLIDQNA